MPIVNLINQFFTFGLYGRLSKEKRVIVRDNSVAAGNPEKMSGIIPSECDFPVEFMYKGTVYNLKDYSTFRVSGNSMSPEGIYSGDSLLAKKADCDKIAKGDFIIIQVDHNFYKERHQDYEALLSYKLRRAIGRVPSSMSEDDVCAMLAEEYEEMKLKEYNSGVIQNLREAREYYRDKELYASITYPDGVMHVSFHAADLISFKVAIVGRPEKGALRYMTPDEL